MESNPGHIGLYVIPRTLQNFSWRNSEYYTTYKKNQVDGYLDGYLETRKSICWQKNVIWRLRGRGIKHTTVGDLLITSLVLY